MRNKNWVRLLAHVTGSVNQDLLLQNEYLAAENRILRAKLVRKGYRRPSRVFLLTSSLRCLSEVLRRKDGVVQRNGRAGALRIEFIERSRDALGRHRVPSIPTLHAHPNINYVYVPAIPRTPTISPLE